MDNLDMILDQMEIERGDIMPETQPIDIYDLERFVLDGKVN